MLETLIVNTQWKSPVPTNYITLWDYAARNKHSLIRFQDSGEKQEYKHLPAKLRSTWRFLQLYHSQKNSHRTKWQLESLCVFQVSSWGIGECTMLSEIQIPPLSLVNRLFCYFLTYNFRLKINFYPYVVWFLSVINLELQI